MFPAGKKDGESVDFDGGRTSDDIVAWAVDKLAENILAPDVTEVSLQIQFNYFVLFLEWRFV